MPIINDTSLTTRKANTVMAGAFMARAKKWLWVKVCASVITTSLIEDYAIGGALPPLVQYNGQMSSTGIPSWKPRIPNPLANNLAEVDRTELVGDQTRTLMRMVDEMGVKLADYPEQLWVSKLLKGGQASSATQQFNGQSLQVTMDGLPVFGNHMLDGSTTQSNIIIGGLPIDLAGIYALPDIAAAAIIMQRDLEKIVYKIKTIKDNNNIPIFPTIETRENILILLPSALEVVGALAFRASGVIGGANGSGGTSGSTSTIAPMFVKDVVCSGYLDGGFPDPAPNNASQVGQILSPPYPTTYYVLMTHDRVKPFYMQLFKPVTEGDLFPKGYNIDSVINSAIKEGGGEVTRAMATYFAGALVEHNFNAWGSNATRDVVTTQKHFASAQWRGNVFCGPWFTLYRVDPVGSSGG